MPPLHYFPNLPELLRNLSAPMSTFDIVCGFVGAAIQVYILGCLILVTATFFVSFHILHPFIMVLFLVLTALHLV